LRVEDFDHAAWDEARRVSLTRYWSGEEAPAERHAEACLLWDDEALSVLYLCRQSEPLIVSASPQVERKTRGLWDRDVCEIFVAPDASVPEHYFEFEAAPTGEWLDVAIKWRPAGREMGWQYHSGIRTAARVRPGLVAIRMRIPFAALSGGPPRAGERWRANLFRCVGAGDARGYLAWQPTHTAEPNFHVPQKFGWLIFED
jgi:hypothetical protein